MWLEAASLISLAIRTLLHRDHASWCHEDRSGTDRCHDVSGLLEMLSDVESRVDRPRQRPRTQRISVLGSNCIIFNYDDMLNAL